MQIKANQLTESDSAQLIFCLLSQVWPTTHFTCATDHGELTICWTDGPWEEDVFRAAETYLAPLDSSDWDNVVIVSHPDGTVEAVMPAIHSVRLNRTVSTKTLAAITAELSQSGRVIDLDSVREILSQLDQSYEDRLDLLARLDHYSVPLPQIDLFAERRRTSQEDALIVELCEVLNSWRINGDMLDNSTFQTVCKALDEPEGRAVLISALSDEAPVPGPAADLVEQVTQRCLMSREYKTADWGRYVLTSIFEDLDTAQPGLFATTRPEMETLNEMGYLLRETVAGARF